jgi:hypothetical protein
MDIDNEAGDTGFDIGASVDAIAGGLGLKGTGHSESDNPSEPESAAPKAAATDETEGTDTTTAPPSPDPSVAAAPAAKPPPKSWAKEKHDLWAKLPTDAQDYYETREKQFLDGLDQYKGEAQFGKAMRDVLNPYKPILQAQGIDEPQAIQYLMNAHYRLTQGSKDQRLEAYQKLGRDLHLVDAPEAAQLPPEVQQLQTRLESIESENAAAKQAQYEAKLEAVRKEIDAVASDPANPYFDDVANDIIAMIKVGYPLKEAYEKAVWANPVTRQKEIARLQTESDKALKEKAKQEAEAARKASSANVRGRDTRRAPTEPKGTMEDTLHETMEKIRNRAH